MSLAIFRLETFACDSLFGNFRLAISVENFHLKSFVLKNSLGNSSFGSFIWKRLPLIFRLIYSAWDVSLGNFRLGSSAWELALRILRDLSLALSL